MSPEERLIQVLREVDERLTAGRASPEIAGRELRGNKLQALEAELDLSHGARTLVLVLLNRQRIAMRPKPRSRRGIVVITAPAVFLREVLMSELAIFERAYEEYLESSAEEIVFNAFGVRIGATVQPLDR